MLHVMASTITSNNVVLSLVKFLISICFFTYIFSEPFLITYLSNIRKNEEERSHATGNQSHADI